jgi:hypothetical protein
MDLVDHVFEEIIENGEAKEDILAMMEYYGLIARFCRAEDSENLHYFVPVKLKSSPEGVLDVEPSPSDPCPLYLHFLDGFTPHGLYNCLVSKLIAWCSDEGYPHEPNIFRSVSRYFIGDPCQCDLLMICRKRFIKVVLRSLPAEQSSDIQPAHAFSVRSFLENCLKELTDQCRWYRFLRYEISVRCPPCSEKKCPKHKCDRCRDDDCLHLLSVTNDRELVCTESFGKDPNPEVLGLEEWYREPSIVSLYYNACEKCDASRFELVHWAVELNVCTHRICRSFLIKPKDGEQCFLHNRPTQRKKKEEYRSGSACRVLSIHAFF